MSGRSSSGTLTSAASPFRCNRSATARCIYSQRGRPRWYHIGDAAAVGLADARKLAGEIMFQVAEGKDQCAERAAQHSKGTFEELAANYCEFVKTKGKKGKPNKSWK